MINFAERRAKRSLGSRGFYRIAILFVAAASMGASQRSANFIVTAPTPEMAAQITSAAEGYRRDLAILWLGSPMPNWSAPCPIEAQVAPHLGAGGATSFLFEHGEVYGWQMTIQGSLERVLDSVLPHEITHTIFATHFRRPLPRWADEGACTTVEHASEKTKQQIMLVDFLRTNRGIPFSRMFVMKEYPRDVMPLYSQGYSLARYLIAQGGRQKFLAFLADGMRDDNWTRAVAQHYTVANLGVLQNTWLEWVRQGSPTQEQASPEALAAAIPSPAARPAPAPRPSSVAMPAPSGPSGTAPAPSSVAASIYRAQIAPLPTAGASASLASAAPRDGMTREGASVAAGEAGWHSPRRDYASYEPAGGSAPASASGTSPAKGAANVAAAPRTPAAPDPVATSATSDQTSHQATRPQPVQQSRQIILEWSRAPNPATAELAPADGRLANGGTVWR